MNGTCHYCGAGVIIGRRDDTDIVLDATPHPLGVHYVENGEIRNLTNLEVLRQVRDGHHKHRCPPAVQGALFGPDQAGGGG